MKIQNETNSYTQYANSSVNNGEQKERTKTAENENEKAGVAKDSNSVFAGNVNLFQDPVEEKKKKAREMAMKLIEEAYAKDKAIDEDLDNRRNHAKELEEENEEHAQMLDGIEKMKAEAREGHGVGEYSQEEKDTQLLLKEAEAGRNWSIRLTDEEKLQLEEIHKAGLTDYQKEMLRLDEGEYEYKKKMEDNEMEIMSEYAVIRGMKIERLKTHDMVDAVKAGDQILQNAQKEIIGMILEEGKTHQDEEMAEKKEKIAEKKEEAEELEEKIEEARARREEATEKRDDDEHEEMYELDSLMQEITEKVANSNLPNVQKSMTQAVNELLLTLDDIKGLAVDTEA